MLGLYNKILRIDVSSKTFEPESIPEEISRRYLGGKGTATHILLEENPPGVDPLSPENLLILATGPLSGSGIWGSCRYGIYTKSPLTGYYSESYSGGTTAEYMAKTGFDLFVLKGTAPNPVWIEIAEDTVHFHPADDLWGLGTYETEDRIKQWIKENRTDSKGCGAMVIGPAGENQVRFAVVENDHWRSAGRTGAGTVMGSKKIKGIVFRGNCKKEFANPSAIKSFIKDLPKTEKDEPIVKALKAYGTPSLVDVMNKAGAFPTRYWQKGVSDHREQINAEALHSRCDVQHHPCLHCFIGCGRMSTVKAGRHAGLKIEGPEYETIYVFGGLCEVDSIEEIAYLNDICDRLGMDTMSAGNLVGLTIEASRQGRIDLDIDYGNVDAIAALLEDIAYKRGHGATLAQGIKSAAAQWEMADQAIHVKGLEPAGYDPRVFKGMGLGYGISDRGACHMRASFYEAELTQIDPDQIQGKAAVFAEWEDLSTVMDTLILCRFYMDIYPWDRLSEVLSDVTGLELGMAKIRSIAGEITDNTRRFNIREGLTAADDHLPKRFSSEALPETKKSITRDQMAILLREYYAARNWDENGVPKSEDGIQ
jgi:aldehyde:ferredoxin oxidoreductase